MIDQTEGLFNLLKDAVKGIEGVTLLSWKYGINIKDDVFEMEIFWKTSDGTYFHMHKPSLAPITSLFMTDYVDYRNLLSYRLSDRADWARLCDRIKEKP